MDEAQVKALLTRLHDLPRKWRENDPPPPAGRYSASMEGALRWCADDLEAALRELEEGSG